MFQTVRAILCLIRPGCGLQINIFVFISFHTLIGKLLLSTQILLLILLGNIYFIRYLKLKVEIFK